MPIEDYEDLMGFDVDEAVRILEDPNTKWIDYDDWLLEEAGRMIAKARKAKGLTQTQLAKKLGIEQSQVSRIERNPDRTTLRTLKKIAKALKVDVRTLID